MVARSGLLLLTLAAAWGALRSAAADTAGTPARLDAAGVCRDLPGLNTLFRFSAGFRPAAPPAVGPDGAVYVGTGDGYVHALHADGSFFWSYTVRGPVTGRAALSNDGRLLLVPAPREIYALRANGSLAWLSEREEGVQSGFTRDHGGTFRFVAGDARRILAFTDRGELLRGHMPGRARVTAGPLALAEGIAVGRANGVIQVTHRGKVAYFRRKKPIQALVTCPGLGLCAIAGHVLTPVEPRAPKRVAFQMPAVYAASARAVNTGESWLAVLTTESRLELFSSLPGEPHYRVELPDQVSAEPALDAQGTTYVPLQSGALLLVNRDGAIAGCAQVANSPLGTPVLDAARRRVLVTTSEGVLAALELP